MVDPKKVRPRPGWVQVLTDPRKETLGSGLIVAPPNETGVEKVTEGAGTVIRVGPGDKNRQLGLEEGCRVVYRSYLKHANKLEVEEKWPDGQEKFYSLISSDDIMGVMAPDVEVGVFSGRPQVPERK